VLFDLVQVDLSKFLVVNISSLLMHVITFVFIKISPSLKVFLIDAL